MSDDGPDFATDLADLILGSHVLVGLTYRNHLGEVDHREQLHGFVSRVDSENVTIQIWGSDRVFTLPPDFRNYEPAPPGEYRLRSTGEVVVDPDFTTSWTVTNPPPAESDHDRSD